MNNIFYISPNFPENQTNSNKYSSLNKCITDINSNYSINDCIIKLYPGTYKENFTIKKPTIIEGNIDNTNLIINGLIEISNNLVIKNINILIYPLINRFYDSLFKIDIQDENIKLLKEIQDNKFTENKNLNREILFYNTKFTIINYDFQYLFLLINGKIRFDNTEIIYNQNKLSKTKVIFSSK